MNNQAETQPEIGPTGIGFLDRSLTPELVSSGLHGILGATGNGISTLALMVAAEGLRQTVKSTDPRTRAHGRWAVVANQTREPELRCRLIAHLGQLFLPPLLEGRLQCAEPGADPTSQFAVAQKIVNSGLCFVDSNFQNRPLGKPPATRIVDALGQQLGSGNYLAGVVIDDVVPPLWRWSDELGLKPRAHYQLMCDFLKACRDLSADHNCPVWIAHPLRGAVGDKPPQELLTHRDAMEFRHMDRYLDSAIVIGNHDVCGAFMVRCTKPHPVSNADAPIVTIGQTEASIVEVDPLLRERFWAPSQPSAAPALLIRGTVRKSIVARLKPREGRKLHRQLRHISVD